MVGGGKKQELEFANRQKYRQDDNNNDNDIKKKDEHRAAGFEE